MVYVIFRYDLCHLSTYFCIFFNYSLFDDLNVYASIYFSTFYSWFNSQFIIKITVLIYIEKEKTCKEIVFSVNYKLLLNFKCGVLKWVFIRNSNKWLTYLCLYVKGLETLGDWLATAGRNWHQTSFTDSKWEIYMSHSKSVFSRR